MFGTFPSAFICGSSIHNAEVLDLLTRLAEKSLVLYEQRGGEGRYRLLEMIREYARERLAASGEGEGLQERHARVFLGLAETAEPQPVGPEQGRWLDRLEWEHDNLRAALAWSLESQEIELGLRLGSALEGFWRPRGYLREGRAHLLRLLAEPGAAVPVAVRARALSTAGLLTSLQGDLKSAQALYEASLAIWRRLEDRAGIATVLHHLGWMAVDQWDVTTARPLAEEGLAIRRELGEPRGLAQALALLAKVRACEGDPAAGVVIEESIATWRALGDRVSITRSLYSLALTSIDRGDLDTARRLCEESLETAKEVGDKAGIGWAVTGLGQVAHMQEEYPAARAFFEQSLPLWRELDDRHGLLLTLGHLGYALKRLGDGISAHARFEEMLAIARAGNWIKVVAASLGLLGNTAADLGRWEEAADRCAEDLRLTCPDEYAQDRLSIAWGLTGLARVAVARGRPARAARLLGATAALRLTVPPFLREIEWNASAARAQMDAAEFEAAWAAGQTAPLEQIIAEALQEAPAA